MIFSLKNEFLEVKISSRGAELCSIISIGDNLEFIWQASPQIWPRHAPILFPIVGKLKDNSYKFNNTYYSLNQHGFARDKDFELVSQEKKKITLKLKSDQETINKFPFHFELKTNYVLDNNVVNIIYEVKNPEDSPLYFSIGAHPGFRCPLYTAEKFEDYYLEFEQEENLIKHKIKDGLISEEQEMILENEKILILKKQLFREDALVFKSFKSKFLFIKNHQNSHQIKVGLDSFPYLGIWTKPAAEASFICIEPWLGIADSIHTDGEFINKEGIIKLEGKQSFICSYNIEII